VGRVVESDQRVYIGEYSAGERHGFGMAILAEGHTYIGRFEAGHMSGVGVYCQPHGVRFEGMYFRYGTCCLPAIYLDTCLPLYLSTCL
jgi:hypothetical protein